MKIVDLRTMRGPSYWSVKHHKLIVTKVDLQEFAGQWSNAIPGFAGRLMKLFPNIGTVQPGGMSGKQAAKRRTRAFVLSRRKGVPAAGRQPTS